MAGRSPAALSGTETARSQRNWISNPTILSGGIGTANVNSDNCYHVVLSVSDGNATVLDGFTIEKGNANGTGNLTVETKTIARNQGGGSFNQNSALQISNCRFSARAAGLLPGWFYVALRQF